MRLTDGVDTINFNPGFGLIEPHAFSEDTSRSLSGKEYRYRWFKKRRWEIPLKNVAKVVADQLNTWRDANEELSFYPDMTNDPTTFYSVTIQNTENPLAAMETPNWATKYAGVLILAED